MQGDYALLRPVGADRRGQGSMRKAAAASTAGALLILLVVVATTGSGRPVQRAVSALQSAVSDSLNTKFLEASAAGAAGKDFLARLQDIWFVESNAGRAELAGDATRMASNLLVAGFPEDMKAAVDVTTNPCEDFYEFACGKWDDENKDSIKAFRSSKALAWDAADRNIREALIKVLEKDDGPAGMYYKSCLDVDHIEQVGVKQLEPWIKFIDAIDDKASMVTAITEFNKHDMDTFFSWGLDTDNRDTTRKSFSLMQGGVSLPDNTYYLEDSAVMQGHREKYLDILAKYLAKIGRGATAEREAQMILDFETKFAGIRVDREESRQDQGTPTTWDEVNGLMPYWPWKQWLQELGSCTPPPDGSAKVCTGDHLKVRLVGQPGETPLYISNQKFFPKLNALLEGTDLDTVKALLRWKIIKKVATYMPADWIDLMVEWNKDLYGTSEKSPRDRKCYYSTSDSAGWPLAKLYIENVFHTENRDAAQGMLELIRAQFYAEFPEEDWMVPADRTAAQEKLKAMFFQVAWPTDKDDKTHWPEITYAMDGKMGSDFMSNFMLKERLAVEKDFNDISKPPNRRSWGGNTPRRHC